MSNDEINDRVEQLLSHHVAAYRKPPRDWAVDWNLRPVLLTEIEKRGLQSEVLHELWTHFDSLALNSNQTENWLMLNATPADVCRAIVAVMEGTDAK